MFNFGDVLDLPLIWGGLIVLAVFILCTARWF